MRISLRDSTHGLFLSFSFCIFVTYSVHLINLFAYNNHVGILLLNINHIIKLIQIFYYKLQRKTSFSLHIKFCYGKDFVGCHTCSILSCNILCRRWWWWCSMILIPPNHARLIRSISKRMGMYVYISILDIAVLLFFIFHVFLPLK